MKKHNQLIKILYLTDFGTNADKVVFLLNNSNVLYDIKVIYSKTEYKKALKEFTPQIIVGNYNLLTFNSIEALNILKQSDLNIPFILIINESEEESAITLLGSGVNDYIINDRLQRLPFAVINALEKNRLEKEIILIRKDDIRFPGELTSTLVKDVSKEERTSMIIDDTSELRLAELERSKITDDLIQHSKKLEQFTYIVSHNLRAPIANILGISNVLKGTVSEAERTKIQHYLFVAVAQLDEIVKDLNTILQIKSEITENKETVNLPELVSGITSSIQHLIEKENVQIVTDFTAIDKTTVVKSYMHSVFYNLISNSIKYRQSNEELIIRIKSEIDNEKIIISFKDNGTGIDLKQHGDKIFGLYKRFHPHIEGRGLGLFMTKTQIEVLGGKISVKSNPNIGTEFIVELPL